MTQPISPPPPTPHRPKAGELFDRVSKYDGLWSGPNLCLGHAAGLSELMEERFNDPDAIVYVALHGVVGHGPKGRIVWDDADSETRPTEMLGDR